GAHQWHSGQYLTTVVHEVHLQFLLSLRLHHAARSEGECGHLVAILYLLYIFQNGIGGTADVHQPYFTAAFHAAGRVHGVTPDIVLEFLHAHDACHDRTAVDTDADLEVG